MRLMSIASGSSGNCIYVGTEATHLLVDTGISMKRTEAGLNGIGLTLRDIDGILITHEHADHIGGLGPILRKYNIPVYGTNGTLQAIKNNRTIGDCDRELFHPVTSEGKFILKDMVVNPMKISHDAADPVAYRFLYEKKKIAVITDLGYYDDYIVSCLKDSDLLFLEANHDVNMLQVGPYPYMLKQRILGKKGHLSNENSGKLLSELLNDHIQSIYLGHLSQENNLPELAYETVKLEIDMAENQYHANDFPIYVAKRSEPSLLAEI